jgi:hypothetical protein
MKRSKVHAAAAGLGKSQAQAEYWVRQGLAGLAARLQAGEDLPADARQWLGDALAAVAAGADPAEALGLARPRGRPWDTAEALAIAASVEFLTHHGMTQTAAAVAMLDLHGRETLPRVVELHNALRRRRAPFDGVAGVVVAADRVTVTTELGQAVLCMDHLLPMLAKSSP